MTREIKYKGVYLQVIGHYEPYDAGDYYQPPYGGYFEIEKIMLEDTDNGVTGGLLVLTYLNG